ncbi:efflux RND transporter periplasmic adaptor subunit [bacterium]|nr:efflux RND transporter periplasmic adaptor subunit [bacterium]
MNKRLIIGGGAVLAVIAVIFLAGKLFPGSETAEEAASPEIRVEVRVTHPVGISDSLEFTAQGRVIAKKSISAAALSEGKIRTVSVAVGERVKQGQTIALLENSELDRELAIQRDKLQTSRTTLDELEKKVSSAGEMLTLGILSERDLISMKQELNALRTEVRDQEIVYERLRMREDNYRIVAGREGYISDILPEQSYVTYGQTVAEIISLEDELIKVFIPFDQAILPVPGDPVNISCNSMTVSGRVLSIFPDADANLIGAIVSPNKPIPVNLEVKVTFRLTEVAGLIIPKSAVVLDEGKPVVFVVRNDVAYKKTITAIKDYLDRVVIRNDLGPDDALVVENAYLLSDQMNVAVR